VRESIAPLLGLRGCAGGVGDAERAWWSSEMSLCAWRGFVTALFKSMVPEAIPEPGVVSAPLLREF
jgi:hypothetical protein